ncbi:MAG: NADH-quinone oxidoreductase subunit C [Candidatus Omnitrophica bacterium]|nr:NADH-quinone oxidoreductase subunit C [Candidatus Omnitrophota bacterium]
MHDVMSDIKERLSNKLLKVVQVSPRRFYCDVAAEHIPEAAKILFADIGCRFATATGVDLPAGIEILYHFSHDSTGKIISLRTLLTDKKSPQIQSIAPLFHGAEWIEREMWELLGIQFIGHPNLKHLLLIDEWPEGEFPLRHKK